MEVEEEMKEGISREEQLRREIEQLDAVTAEFIAVAGDLLKGSELSPSNVRTREEVIELLGVNYVGPEMLGRLLYGNESKFPHVDLDFVKLREILNEPDEWESTKKRFETYALVFKPPISFLELRDRANDVASAQGKTPAFRAQLLYATYEFATDVPMGGSWELVRRGTVPRSTSKSFNQQKALLSDKTALTHTTFPALAALLVGQYLEHDIKLYKGKLHYGRAPMSAARHSDPVGLGDMSAKGASVQINYYSADSHVGLAISRNLN